MLSHLPFKDKLTLLFCLLDDFLNLLPKPNPALSSGRHPAGRRPKLTAAEILTLALLRFWTVQGNCKAFYNLIQGSCGKEFPTKTVSPTSSLVGLRRVVVLLPLLTLTIIGSFMLAPRDMAVEMKTAMARAPVSMGRKTFCSMSTVRALRDD